MQWLQGRSQPAIQYEAVITGAVGRVLNGTTSNHCTGPPWEMKQSNTGDGDPPPPQAPTMPGNAAHHRCVTVVDPEPSGPVLHFPDQMWWWWRAPTKLFTVWARLKVKAAGVVTGLQATGVEAALVSRGTASPLSTITMSFPTIQRQTTETISSSTVECWRTS